MGRPPKVQKDNETKADIINKLVQEIDPEILIAGVLGATATLGGVTPPFTRLLMTANAAIGDDIPDALAKAKSFLTGPYGIGEIPVALFMPWSWFVDSSSSGSTSSKPEGKAEMWGLAASGALEAMIMMSFAKNPEAMKVLSEGLKGITSMPVPLPV